MERRTTNGYIWIGTAVRFLRDARSGMRIFSDDGEGWVDINIDGLLRRLDEFDLHVTRRVADRLEKWLYEMEDERSEAVASGKSEHDFNAERKLTAKEAESLVKTAGEIQTTLIAEARGQVAFITREKRYGVENLLDNVGKLMAPGVFDALPEMARYDFAEAGRCIAFEVPTAGAFHVMRGTEATIKDFYCRIVKRDRVDPLMWGPMTNHLRKRRDTPPVVLMDNLDNLRRSFRNPTQHPEKIYDIDEAQDLMSLSIDVVSRMTRHLHDQGK